MESNISSLVLSPDYIRQRLAATTPPRGTEDMIMPPGSSRWPDSILEKLSGTLKPAGVLVPIMQRRNELTVLLTRRSAELKHHGGQVSFPGGRMEDCDADVAAAALREAEEEVGIATHEVSVVGYLATMPTITGYAVSPVVGLVPGTTELVIDATEVEYAFEVPLPFLLDAANDIHTEWQSGGRKLPMIEFHWQGERIWGATAFMIISLRKMLLKQ